MKAILASLLCFVLVASESFALKGGPPYPVGTGLPGLYAGVLQPAFDPTDPFSSNSLGLFTLGIPTTGASSGNLIIFSRGRVYSGSIQGITDTNTATVSALLNATFDYTLTSIDPNTGQPVSINVTATITGPFSAKIVRNRNAGVGATALLRGSATGFLSNGGVDGNGDPIIDGTLTFAVFGFKQSNTAPSGGSLGPPTGGG